MTLKIPHWSAALDWSMAVKTRSCDARKGWLFHLVKLVYNLLQTMYTRKKQVCSYSNRKAIAGPYCSYERLESGRSQGRRLFALRIKLARTPTRPCLTSWGLLEVKLVRANFVPASSHNEMSDSWTLKHVIFCWHLTSVSMIHTAVFLPLQLALQMFAISFL